MIITNIERQKKNKQRFSIFVDDQYAFSVSEDVYAQYVLHSGQELTDDERQEIEQSESASTAKRLALRFRSYRPRSTKEVSDYLRKKGCGAGHIQQALDYLRSNSLLNDEEYARMVCRDKLLLRPIGRQSMKQFLLKKGIDRTIVEKVLNEQYSPESELQLAQTEGERKLKRVSSSPPLLRKKKIYEHLRRRGYDHSLSLTVASQLVPI